MPSSVSAPRFAVLAAFDARQWESVQVLTFGGDEVRLPSGEAYAQGAVYEDVIDFLSGRRDALTGVAAALSAAWVAEGGAETTWTVGIDEDDRVFVQSDAVDFRFTTGSAAKWSELGFTSAAESLTGSGPPYRHTAASGWTRGPIQVGAADVTDNTDNAAISPHLVWPQSAPIYLRAAALSDADAAVVPAGGSLEDLINAAASMTSVRLHLTEGGRVRLSWSHAEAGETKALVWSDTAFRDRLGFAGDEPTIELLWAGRRVITATHRCPGVLVPSRPLERLDGTVRVAGARLGLASGAMASVRTGAFYEWAVSGYIDSLFDADDGEAHFMREVAPYLAPGARVTLYPEWGESRRALRVPVTVSTPAYSTLHTSQDGSYRGRIRGHVLASEWSAAPSGTMRRRIPLALQLQEAPG